MRYIGSKRRLIKYLKPIIESYLKPGMKYLEPFVGGANMITEIEWDKKIGADINAPLINLLIHFRDNDPKFFKVSKEQYYFFKEKFKNGENDWVIGYVGFFCSYLSKFYGSYDDRESYLLGSFNSLYKQSKKEGFKKIKFISASFEKLKITNSLVYLDPPYKNTCKYTNIKSLDYDMLWKKCYEWSKSNNIILLSELNAPDFFECIWQKDMKYTLGGNTVNKIEKLFIYNKEKYEVILNVNKIM